MVQTVAQTLAQRSDADLARQISCATGRACEAEQELCSRYARRVRSYGLRHLRSASEADDLMQRVLLVVLSKLRAGEVHQPERIGSFVLGTARLTAQSMRRHTSSREAAAEQPEDLPELAVRAPEPLDRERLVACLQRLAERERSVVLRSFFEGASTAEIAQDLGMDAGHVRVVRHRSLSSLRTCMEPMPEAYR